MITNKVEMHLNTHPGKHSIDDVAGALCLTYQQAACALKMLASDRRALRVGSGIYKGAVFCRENPAASFLKSKPGQSLSI